MASISFNATSVAPQQPQSILPAGMYHCMAVESDVTPTKSGTGMVARFTLQVIDGQFAGRKLFARINIQNQHPEAERIGQSQLSALCHAVGVLNVTDTAQLHNKPFRAKVKIRKDATGQYEDQNEVSGFEAVSGGPGSPAGAFASPVPAQPAAPAAAAATPPWKRAAA